MPSCTVHFPTTYTAARWLALRSEIVDALHLSNSHDFELDVSFSHGTSVTVNLKDGDEDVARQLERLARDFDGRPADPESDYSSASEGGYSPP
ncbi:hypothetical protein A1Q2_01536 [Trichosporon asahii var. asahii CBS 8904]|uniref:Uncharacterized protein n=2 Tax=Trichosporon asahii var. asahii TaxID=189963 RepID=K1VJD4_TRIAC|nr:hypothetical protein A1Q1_05166 [Trichosporon asahii var. asahii CBS 2479]EJT46209.1 hypothetical protein A1Q1_05166 [Trichosporon asahii var. asahii CBS 2479]EKD04190.1 hypothetical protein A1Q2_01536 [Trichosporon asahii var. asahii CBS 8904]